MELSETQQTGLGAVNISKDVVARVAGIAAMECYGLVGMAGRNLQDGIAQLLQVENLNRGVDVHLDGNEAVIDLYVIVEYGLKISEVGYNIMERVKYALESLLGLSVQKVNVHVQGVRVTSQDIGRLPQVPENAEEDLWFGRE